LTKRWRAAGARVLAVLLVTHAVNLGAADGPVPRMFSESALRRAVATESEDRDQIDPRLNWSRVTALARKTRIVVVIEGQLSSLAGTLAAVDDTSLSIRVSPTGRVERVPRPQVLEVRAATQFRGSRLGAVVGGAAGGVLGFITALNLAFRDCGGDCGDEKLLIGLSLVGMPVGGALAGYFGFGRKGGLEAIYLRP
jgi:hypothetical protein